MVSRLKFSKIKPALRKRGAAASRWTKNETIALRRLAGKEPLWRIAQILGRSELSIRWKSKKEDISLGWKVSPNPNSENIHDNGTRT
jgi:hypothetical protein